MAALDHPLGPCLARIQARNGAIVGVGFLVEPQLICTCAHVIADALGIDRDTVIKPTDTVSVDFSFVGRTCLTAAVEVWAPIGPGGEGDIATLRLSATPPPGAKPARLLPGDNAAGRPFDVHGHPARAGDEGRWADGVIGHRTTRPKDWVQLNDEKAQGLRVQQGFSGGPVWDRWGGGVVGMVVAEDTDPTAKVAFMIPMQVIRHVRPDLPIAMARRRYPTLTEGLHTIPGVPVTGMEQHLDEYLGTPAKPVPFGGRHAQLDELDAWLADPSHFYALVAAPAGRGKSALVTRWVADVAGRNRADVAFVPVSLRFDTARQNQALGLLGARLRHLRQVDAGAPSNDVGVWTAEVDQALREDRRAGRTPLIVLDGTDEAIDWAVGRDLRFPSEPGQGVKVLVSTRILVDRDTNGWLQELRWDGLARPLDLRRLDRAGFAEALESMGNPLAGLATQIDVLKELVRLSEGEPLLVRLYVEALLGKGEQAAFITPEELETLERGLAGYIKRWWEEHERQWGTDEQIESAVEALLGVLASALGPLTCEDVVLLIEKDGIKPQTLDKALRVLARFIVGDGRQQGFVFSHPRLTQYVRDEWFTKCGQEGWEHRFLDRGRQTLEALRQGDLTPNQASAYIVQHHGEHLDRAGAPRRTSTR